MKLTIPGARVAGRPETGETSAQAGLAWTLVSTTSMLYRVAPEPQLVAVP